MNAKKLNAGLAVIAGLSLVVLAGCQQDRVKGPRTAAADPVPLAGYPNILLRDGLDEQLVLLGDPIVKPSTDSLPMTVRVRLRSVADKTLMVRYRFRFYGPDREVLTRDPVWYTVDIQPTHDRTFEAGALQLLASGWELEVKKF